MIVVRFRVVKVTCREGVDRESEEFPAVDTRLSLAFLAILITIALLVRAALRHGVQSKAANSEIQKRIDAARGDGTNTNSSAKS